MPLDISSKLEALYLEKEKIEKEIFALEKEIEQNTFNHFILKDAIYINTSKLSRVLQDALKELVTFPNPQIQILQNLRKPTYNISRTIKGYEEDKHNSLLILPRGMMRGVIEIFKENNIQSSYDDKRFYKEEVFPKVVFNLRDEQEKAINQISKKDF